MGSRMGPELTRIDHISDPPDWSRDDPQIDLRDPQIDLSQTAVSKEVFLTGLLTIADIKDLSSKDWIRAPSQSQE